MTAIIPIDTMTKQAINAAAMLSRPDGYLIAFEGIDGSGKGTALNAILPRLQEACKRLGRELIITKEPGGTKVGNTLRELMFQDPTTKRMHPDLPALLMLAAHLQHIHEVIRPGLARGAVIVTDRYFYSHYAYQPSRGGHPIVTLGYELLQGPEADLVVYMRGNPQRMLARAKSRTSEVHQSAKNWSHLRGQIDTASEYEHILHKHPNVCGINGEDHIDIIADQIWHAFEQTGITTRAV